MFPGVCIQAHIKLHLSTQDSQQLLGASGTEEEGASLVVVFRALFPSGQTGEDDGTAFEAFGAVDGVTSDGVARCWVLNVGMGRMLNFGW